MSLLSMVTTVGLEIEVEDILLSRLPRIIDGFPFVTTHDASCETPVFTLGGIPISGDEVINNFQLRRGTLGGEIVSGTIDTEENYLKGLIELTRILTNFGESPQSYRAGLHVHVSLPRPTLRMLKRAMEVAFFVEPLFFRLGGMGYRFRGELNDSIYCRPLTQNGPTVIQTNWGFAQCIQTKNLLDATSVSQFVKWYGDIREDGNPERYIPVRYHWLNLVPIFSQNQTLEFRVFNKSLNPFYIKNVIELCKVVASLIIKSGFRDQERIFPEFSAFDSDNDDNDKLFEILSNLPDVTGEMYDVITEIILNTPPVKLKNELVYSHLYSGHRGNITRVHWEDSRIRDNIVIIKEKNIKTPNYIDSHSLE